MDSMRTTVSGRFLVRGGRNAARIEPHPLDRAQTMGQWAPLFISDTPISFWGGIDPITGIIIDHHHPLYQKCISNVILCIPSGRGSCTTSQVLLELILNGIAPRAIVVRDMDALLCIGAIIAQEFFPSSNPSICDILHVGSENFIHLLNFASEASPLGQRHGQSLPLYGRILSSGEFHLHAVDDGDQSKFILYGEDPDPQISASPEEWRLSLEEKLYYDQCTTDAERMALKVIFRYAHLSWSASDRIDYKCRYLPIKQAHIDGCTYIGPGGLDFVRRLIDTGGRVKVPTTLNSVSTDRRYWQKYHVPESYATNAIALGDGYLALGCTPSFTCAPYLLASTPKLGHDIAWGESNAVVYANSVLGARTEKYADYLDICCAIAGVVPAIGVHNTEQRRPTIVLDGTQAFQDLHRLSESLDFDLLFPTLGHLCGSISDGRVPIVLGLEDWSVSADQLKAFCAAFGTTGASPLVHIAGITPETTDTGIIDGYVASCGKEVRTITIQDLYQTFQTLDSSANLTDDGKGNLTEDVAVSESINLVALGNPHLSVSECSAISRLIQGTKTDSSNSGIATTRVIACLSRNVYNDANSEDINTMLKFGIEFVFDTCWCMLLNEPIIPSDPRAVILTNSGKYAHYGPGLTKRRFRYGSLSDCVIAARSGLYPRRLLPKASVLSPSTVSESPTTTANFNPYASFLLRPQHRLYSTSTKTWMRPKRSIIPIILSFVSRKFPR